MWRGLEGFASVLMCRCKGQLFRVYFLVCTGYGTQKKDGCGNFNLNFKSNVNHNIAVIMTAEPS